MANREENLKKINSELEMLNDEQLDEIAGGTIGQTAGDSQILYDYGLMDRHYGNYTRDVLLEVKKCGS